MADETLPPAQKAEPKNRTLSFRPKDGAMFSFVQALIDKHGTAAKAIEHCVVIAMGSPNDPYVPVDEKDRQKLGEQDQCKGLIESRKENPAPTGIELIEKDQAFITRLIDKKSTTQEEAIKFCVKYTRENIILW